MTMHDKPEEGKGPVCIRVAAFPRREPFPVARGCVYVCPTSVPADAHNVEIAVYPDPPLTGAFGVRVRGRGLVAELREYPAKGERVLVFLLHHDLLSLFVATVEAS